MSKKQRIVTFKADDQLAENLNNIPNKSDFIRKAVQNALEQKCPLCSGTGVLSPDQQQHLDYFLSLHSLEKCGECEAIHFVCHDNVNHESH
jgi:hypothetical protein